MKRILILTLFYIIPILVFSQNWAPIESKWHYEQYVFDFPSSTFKVFETIGDTIINEKLCSVIMGNCDCGSNELINYMYEDSNKVYYLNNDQFYLLYDFNLNSGESWSVKIDSETCLELEVDSVSFLNIGTDSLKVQYISSTSTNDADFHLGDRIIERIGSDNCMFPVYTGCSPETGPIRCYEDELIGLQMFNGYTECDIILGLSKIETIGLEIIPNPFSTSFVIKLENEVSQIKIYSSDGRLILNDENPFNEKKYNLSKQSSGIYFIHIWVSEKETYVRKILKK